MDATVTPCTLAGAIEAIASKSIAHRQLICAAFADAPTDIACNTSSEDIDATARCLVALGATVQRTDGGFHVEPVGHAVQGAVLDCKESGSTLRFLLPVVAALGNDSLLTGQGRLPQRPLSPLYEQLVAHGAHLSPQGAFPLEVTGSLSGGDFELAGDVSSQFVSGLLLAAPLLADDMRVHVRKPVESRSYIDLTVDALASFGINVAVDEQHDEICFTPAVGCPLISPGRLEVEGDWSNAAFWLAAGAVSPHPVTVTGLNPSSAQGDRTIVTHLRALGACIEAEGGAFTARMNAPRAARIDVGDCPDLVPPLAAVASVCEGTTRIVNAGRLRIKESDRLLTVSEGLSALGAHVAIEGDSLIIEGCESLGGGVVDAAGDHRIAMMAAIAATRCTSDVTIVGAQCVSKSYPGFFSDFVRLGGRVRLER